ncbi:hypothetical protein VTN31DRAFT_5104 [Thermomyces dupontii]|uniref:uncharacterized protein n=1 Tax=Talaromyces thermophilus TaxID=28565 RepID=UPI00374313E1
MPPKPASGAKPPKTMSSRLLTMKFMQRAAAAQAQQPSASASTTEPFTPSPKRPRLSPSHSPAISESSSTADLQAINAAIAAEEEKRAAAVARAAAEAGETQWVLDYTSGAAATIIPQQPPRPVAVAADSLDAELDDDDDDAVDGSSARRCYGSFKSRQKRHSYVYDDAGDASDGAKERKQPIKEVSLRHLTSISGGRSAQAAAAAAKESKKKKKKVK